jgi:phosphoglycolate phosphatase
LVRPETDARLGLIRLAIFDLDGTLIDSQTDLVNSVNATRIHMGLGVIEPRVVASYVGNGAPVLIQRSLGPDATAQDCERALAYFLSYYRDHMLDHTDLYPGVRDALDRLRAAGVRMAVLTNKPVRFSEGIIDGLGLATHFSRIYGGNSFTAKKPHPIGIDTLRSELAAPREQTLMVGDSAVDVRTARNAGVAACGVTFGFQPETFDDSPPDFLIDDMRDLASMILSG